MYSSAAPTRPPSHKLQQYRNLHFSFTYSWLRCLRGRGGTSSLTTKKGEEESRSQILMGIFCPLSMIFGLLPTKDLSDTRKEKIHDFSAEKETF